MKKLLVLALVLSLATMANAALQVEVDGADVTEIALAPGGGATLSIFTDAVIAPATANPDNFYYALVIGSGTIDYTSGIVVPADAGLSIEHTLSAVDMGFPLDAGDNGLGGGVILFQLPNLAAGTTIFDAIALTGVMTSTTIKLYESPDGATMNLVDTVAVTVPEPMTLGLLGLGGLFLRRRSK